MATYSKRTGSTGTMYIHDDGKNLTYIIDPGQTATRNASMPWRYTINGTTSSWKYYNLTSGGGQRTLATFTSVTTNQTVAFELGDTGTDGLGGPTRMTADIKRVGAPPQPPA